MMSQHHQCPYLIKGLQQVLQSKLQEDSSKEGVARRELQCIHCAYFFTTCAHRMEIQGQFKKLPVTVLSGFLGSGVFAHRVL